MVKRISGYQCGTESCKKYYFGEGAKRKAETCEAQGIIGPHLRPGFVFKTKFDFPLINLGEMIDGHYIGADFLEIRYSLNSLIEECKMNQDFQTFISLPSYFERTKKVLETPERFMLLNNKEFTGLCNAISKSSSLGVVKEELELMRVPQLFFNQKDMILK